MTPIYVNPNIVPGTVQISNKVVQLQENGTAMQLKGKIARLRDGTLILKTKHQGNYTVGETTRTLDGRMACVVDLNSTRLGPAIRIQEVFKKSEFIGITTPVYQRTEPTVTIILSNPRNLRRPVRAQEHVHPHMHHVEPAHTEVIWENPRLRTASNPAVVTRDSNGRTLVFQQRGAAANPAQPPVHHVGHAPVGRR